MGGAGLPRPHVAPAGAADADAVVCFRRE
jgi:hypothetical protein